MPIYHKEFTSFTFISLMKPNQIGKVKSKAAPFTVNYRVDLMVFDLSGLKSSISFLEMIYCNIPIS